MLDNKGQVKAFKILSSSGLVTPWSITICRKATSQLTASANAISALLPTGIIYPATISTYTARLPVFTQQINQAGIAANELVNAISPYTTPSDLLQMKLGWECHVKGNEIAPAPPFSLVTGMGDTQTPQNLLDAAVALDIGALSSAMNAINLKMTASVPPTPPAFTESEILALKNAVNTTSTAVANITTKGNAVSSLAAKIKVSTVLAEKGLENAVAITLTDMLSQDPVMLPAISLIMPEGVISALQTQT